MNIAFVGKAGAGKTYLQKYLIENKGYAPAKMAYPVYMIAEKYLGMDPNKKDRKLLQYLGTDVARERISDNVWVDTFLMHTWVAQTTAKELYGKELKFCSDDVRFKNEHDALVDDGWVLIYLDVSDEIRIQRLSSRDGDAQVAHLGHRSETEIDIFKDECYQLDASGTVEQAQERLDELLEHIQRERKGDESQN